MPISSHLEDYKCTSRVNSTIASYRTLPSLYFYIVNNNNQLPRLSSTGPRLLHSLCTDETMASTQHNINNAHNAKKSRHLLLSLHSDSCTTDVPCVHCLLSHVNIRDTEKWAEQTCLKPQPKNSAIPTFGLAFQLTTQQSRAVTFCASVSKSHNIIISDVVCLCSIILGWCHLKCLFSYDTLRYYTAPRDLSPQDFRTSSCCSALKLLPPTSSSLPSVSTHATALHTTTLSTMTLHNTSKNTSEDATKLTAAKSTPLGHILK